MRLLRALLVVGAVLAAAAPEVVSVETSRASLEGEWEAVIASPKRPWIFVVRFKPVGSGWTGGMSIHGLPDLPLGDIRVKSTEVHFRFPAELDAIAFDGTLIGGEIVGQVLEDGKPTPTRLVRVPPLPKPADRVAAWKQDLDFASTHLLDYDRSFTAASRKAFQQAVARLKADLPRKTDAEILVALSGAVAQIGNAHTRLRLDPTRWGSFRTTYPIRFWWFSDGPFVIRTAASHRRALRCRLVAIDKHPIAEAREKVSRVFAGNAGWADYLSPIYLTSPDVLFGLGLTGSAKEASFTFEDTLGARFSVTIKAEPLAPDAMPNESWQELSPLAPTGKPPWATALASDSAALPLYLRRPEQPYWFELIPGSELLYLQFNHSDDASEGPTLDSFGASFLAFARQRPFRGVVLDLRLNSGGNLDVAKGFMRSLAKDEKINRKGKLFVVVSRCTFSAGLYHAAQLKQLSQAVFVGEAVGDGLDYWAEGGEIVLPNSQAVISYSNGFHRYSLTDYPENKPYYEELGIPSLAPDVPVALSSKEYFSGRDPALAAIEARVGK